MSMSSSSSVTSLQIRLSESSDDEEETLALVLLPDGSASFYPRGTRACQVLATYSPASVTLASITGEVQQPSSRLKAAVTYQLSDKVYQVQDGHVNEQETNSVSLASLSTSKLGAEGQSRKPSGSRHVKKGLFWSHNSKLSTEIQRQKSSSFFQRRSQVPSKSGEPSWPQKSSGTDSDSLAPKAEETISNHQAHKGAWSSAVMPKITSIAEVQVFSQSQHVPSTFGAPVSGGTRLPWDLAGQGHVALSGAPPQHQPSSRIPPLDKDGCTGVIRQQWPPGLAESGSVNGSLLRSTEWGRSQTTCWNGGLQEKGSQHWNSNKAPKAVPIPKSCSLRDTKLRSPPLHRAPNLSVPQAATSEPFRSSLSTEYCFPYHSRIHGMRPCAAEEYEKLGRMSQHVPGLSLAAAQRSATPATSVFCHKRGPMQEQAGRQAPEASSCCWPHGRGASRSPFADMDPDYAAMIARTFNLAA